MNLSLFAFTHDRRSRERIFKSLSPFFLHFLWLLISPKIKTILKGLYSFTLFVILTSPFKFFLSLRFLSFHYDVHFLSDSFLFLLEFCLSSSCISFASNSKRVKSLELLLWLSWKRCELGIPSSYESDYELWFPISSAVQFFYFTVITLRGHEVCSTCSLLAFRLRGVRLFGRHVWGDSSISKIWSHFDGVCFEQGTNVSAFVEFSLNVFGVVMSKKGTTCWTATQEAISETAWWEEVILGATHFFEASELMNEGSGRKSRAKAESID